MWPPRGLVTKPQFLPAKEPVPQPTEAHGQAGAKTGPTPQSCPPQPLVVWSSVAQRHTRRPPDPPALALAPSTPTSPLRHPTLSPVPRPAPGQLCRPARPWNPSFPVSPSAGTPGREPRAGALGSRGWRRQGTRALAYLSRGCLGYGGWSAAGHGGAFLVTCS